MLWLATLIFTRFPFFTLYRAQLSNSLRKRPNDPNWIFIGREAPLSYLFPNQSNNAFAEIIWGILNRWGILMVPLIRLSRGTISQPWYLMKKANVDFPEKTCLAKCSFFVTLPLTLNHALYFRGFKYRSGNLQSPKALWRYHTYWIENCSDLRWLPTTRRRYGKRSKWNEVTKDWLKGDWIYRVAQWQMGCIMARFTQRHLDASYKEAVIMPGRNRGEMHYCNWVSNLVWKRHVALATYLDTHTSREHNEE